MNDNFLLFILIVFCVLGCSGDKGHPKMKRMPGHGLKSQKVEIINIDDLNGSNISSVIRKKYTIGSLTGEDGHLFGQIKGVVGTRENRWIVLDGGRYEIQVFTNSGEFVKSVGRKGAGPGEFRYPSILAGSENGWFIEVEGDGRVQLFDTSGGIGDPMDEFSIDFTPEDACILNDLIYLHGFTANHPEHSIHVYSRQGKRIRSFGPTYETENLYVRESLSTGSIACDEHSERITFAFGFGPFVYGYSLDGKRQWTSRLSSFEPVPVKQTDERSLKYLWNTSPGKDLIQNLHDLSGPGVVVQKEEQYPDERKEKWYSYVVSTRSGTGKFIGSFLEGPVQYASQKQLVTGANVPYPKVDVYDVGEIDWDRMIPSGK